MSGNIVEFKEPIQVTTEIEIPDGGYGWLVVFAFFLYNFCTWGANAGYAIYLEHYLEINAFPDASKLDYAAIGGIAFGAGLLWAPLITWLSYRLGIHGTIGLGIIFQGTALLLAAFSKKLWQIYLTQGVLISFGLAFIYIPSMTLLPQWFKEKRSLASGIATAGSGLGGIVFNLGMQKIIQVKSVKWALIVQFIICTSLSCLALLLTKTRREVLFKEATYKIRLFDQELFSNVGAWLVFGWVSFTMLGYVILLYSLSAFTTSLGYSSEQGSYVSCMISVGNLFGRPFVGLIADRYGPITLGFIIHLIVAILCWAMWIPCQNLATALIFALVIGMLIGTVWLTVGAIIVRVVGLKKLDIVLGGFWIFTGLFAAPSPVIGLQLRTDRTDERAYLNTAIFAGFAYFGAALCLLLLRGYISARDDLYTGALCEDEEFKLKTDFKSFWIALISLKPSRRKI